LRGRRSGHVLARLDPPHLRLRARGDGHRGDGGTAALLELRGALRCPPGPFAQALHVARLREVERRQDREAEHGGEARVGTDLLD
jgi:hypothetical protein